MGLLIKNTDFTGKYKISQNVFSDLDSYIAKFEELYLIDLLGVELFKLFKLDVTAYAPVSVIYLNLFNAIREDDNECIKVSEGIKEMLLGFIYFEFVRDDKYKNTVSGASAATSEISREVGFGEFNIYARYNKSIESYNTIQWYIDKNIADYPLYNGRTKKLIYWV